MNLNTSGFIGISFNLCFGHLVTQAPSFLIFLHQLLLLPGGIVAKPRRSNTAGAQPSTKLPKLVIQLPQLP